MWVINWKVDGRKKSWPHLKHPIFIWEDSKKPCKICLRADVSLPGFRNKLLHKFKSETLTPGPVCSLWFIEIRGSYWVLKNLLCPVLSITLDRSIFKMYVLQSSLFILAFFVANGFFFNTLTCKLRQHGTLRVNQKRSPFNV
jgi:hypothetical protein